MNYDNYASVLTARFLVAFLFTCLWGAPPAFGQSPKPAGTKNVHVLQLASTMPHAYNAVRLTKALEQKVINTPGVTFVNSNKTFIDMLEKAKCGDAFLKAVESDAALTEESDKSVSEACETRIAAPIGAPFRAADNYLWGYIYEASDKQLRAVVHLWRRGQRGTKVVLPFDPSASEHVADRLARRLFGDGRVGDVKLVPGGPVRGDLYINDEPAGRWDPTTAERTLATGPTRFEVRDGSKPVARGQGEVKATEPLTVRLESVVEAPPVPAQPIERPVPPPPPPSQPASSWQTTVGWVGVGTGAALLAVGAFATVRGASLSNDFDTDVRFTQYRAAMRDGTEACDAADKGAVSTLPGAATPSVVRDRCSSLSTMRTLQPVGFVGGGLLAAGGVILLLTAPSRTAPATSGRAWRFLPSAGPSLVGGTVRFTW